MSVIRRSMQLKIINKTGLNSRIEIRPVENATIRMQRSDSADEAQTSVHPQPWSLSSIVMEFFNLAMYGPTHSKVEISCEPHSEFTTVLFADGAMQFTHSWNEPAISWKNSQPGIFKLDTKMCDEIVLEIRADMGQCYTSMQYKKRPAQIESVAIETTFSPVNAIDLEWEMEQSPTSIMYYRKGIQIRDLLTKD